MCPPGGNIVRFPSIFGEFEMPTMGGHMGPPLRREGKMRGNCLTHFVI